MLLGPIRNQFGVFERVSFDELGARMPEPVRRPHACPRLRGITPISCPRSASTLEIRTVGHVP
jgi:hypothetical protein